MLYPQMISYSIEVLALLAGLKPKKSMQAKQLSKILNIPADYLAKVMTQLTKKKLVQSKTGPTGGFSLVVDPDKVTLYRIVASLDGVRALEDDCVMGLGKCSPATPCVFHDHWSEFKKDAVAKAQEFTLTEVSQVLLRKLRVVMSEPQLTFEELAKSHVDA
jgi:Rrf2 family protein